MKSARIMILLSLVSANAAASFLFPDMPIEQPTPQGTIAAPVRQAIPNNDPEGQDVLSSGKPEQGDWYAALGRPPVVLYMQQRLERNAEGWEGQTRVVLDSQTTAGGKVAAEHLTVGVEHKPLAKLEAQRPDILKSYQFALTRELKNQHIRVVDGVIAQRASSAQKPLSDAEYSSLKANAGVIIEVEFVSDSKNLLLHASAKNLKTHELVATARVTLTSDYRSTAQIDKAARQLVQKLLNISPRV